MKSVVELEIAGPRAVVAELFADPKNLPQWMDDLARVELVSGELGKTASMYRMVPKRGHDGFLATVTKRALPATLELSLAAPRLTVGIVDRFVAVSDGATKLVSEETFEFEGTIRRLIGYVAGPAIRRAHRRHMEAFKRFAEGFLVDSARCADGT